MNSEMRRVLCPEMNKEFSSKFRRSYRIQRCIFRRSEGNYVLREKYF